MINNFSRSGDKNMVRNVDLDKFYSIWNSTNPKQLITTLKIKIRKNYIFSVHQNQAVEFHGLVIWRSVSGEPDVGQRGVLLFQLNAENVDVFSGRVQNVHQFVFELVGFAPDQALRLMRTEQKETMKTRCCFREQNQLSLLYFR